MKNTITYRGYVGSVEFSEEDKIFFGKVQGIRSLISYEGKDGETLIADFHNAVDDYLELCKQRCSEPEKAYKGTFNVRISPDLHKKAALFAMEREQSLNSLIETAVESFLATKAV